jgi:hypothetical protein
MYSAKWSTHLHSVYAYSNWNRTTLINNITINVIHTFVVKFKKVYSKFCWPFMRSFKAFRSVHGISITHHNYVCFHVDCYRNIRIILVIKIKGHLQSWPLYSPHKYFFFLRNVTVLFPIRSYRIPILSSCTYIRELDTNFQIMFTVHDSFNMDRVCDIQGSWVETEKLLVLSSANELCCLSYTILYINITTSSWKLEFMSDIRIRLRSSDTSIWAIKSRNIHLEVCYIIQNVKNKMRIT